MTTTGPPLRVQLVGEPGTPFVRGVEERLDGAIDLRVGKEPTEGMDFSVLVSGRPSEAWLDASPALEWLVIPFAGVPEITRERLSARPDLRVANLHHNASATAETALALLLAAAKQIIPADRGLRGGDWRIRYDTESGVLLEGRRALLLGHGAIGGRIAAALTALGLEVRAVVRDPTRHAEAPIPVLPVSQLDAELPAAEVIVVSLPDTEATRGLLDARRLSLLPEGAILVNVGRAAVIDEGALYRALSEGPLGAAGIDVWYRYPESEEARSDCPPGERPFGTLENLVLSPHRAGHARGIEQLRAEHCVRALAAIAAGEDPEGVVDLSRGY